MPEFSAIPEDLKLELSKRNADLGLGSKGRKIVSRYKRKAEESLKRNKRSSFNPMNFDRFVYFSKALIATCYIWWFILAAFHLSLL